MKKRMLTMLAAVMMLSSVLAPISVYAWGEGEDITTTTEFGTVNGGDDSTHNGETTDGGVKKVLPLEGSIGKFDPTVDPGDDPGIAEGDKKWIHVTVPTRMLFASTQHKKNKIVGPKYKLTNNSARDVEIYAESVKLATGSEWIKDSVLNLRAFDATNTVIEDAALNGTGDNGAKLVNGNAAAAGDFMAADNKLLTLKAGTASGGKGTSIDTNKGSVYLQLAGTVTGAGGTDYDYEQAAKNIKVEVTLKFKAVPKA